MTSWGEKYAAVPPWRREPYRLFFPAGLALAWFGVGHWVLHAMGVLPDYKPVFHAIAQIQGFMTCFAVGFLFTAIPRRTGTAPPAAWQMILGLLLPWLTAVSAWFELLPHSQLCWLPLMVLVLVFAARRFLARDAGRRPPNSFIWVPISFAMGISGSLLTAAPGIMGPEGQGIHDLGRLLLLQGMFLGLIVGIGGMVLPLITCGDAPADGARGEGLNRAGHLLAAALLVLSFWIENSVSLQGGYALRFAVVLGLLFVSGRIWRLPRVPGWHRWAVWLSAWALPAGYLLALLYPAQKKAGLHVVFIGGFALMALSVAVHVTLAHGGYPGMVRGRPWAVPLYAGFLLLAAVLRGLVDFDPNRFFVWIGASAATFLIGSLFWVTLVGPRIGGVGSPDP